MTHLNTAGPDEVVQPEDLHDEAREIREDPMRFGVGARVTVAVMADNFVDVILGALRDVDSTGLAIETTDVSTLIQGGEADLLRYLTDLGSAVAASGHHAVMNVLLTRGCPGETKCALPGDAGPRAVETPVGRETGQYATADWVLYPLADSAGNGETDHMRDIMAAIEYAQERQVFDGEQHFASRLAGDFGTLMEVAVGAWTLAGRNVQHVTSHLTFSLNSPTHPRD